MAQTSQTTRTTAKHRNIFISIVTILLGLASSAILYAQSTVGVDLSILIIAPTLALVGLIALFMCRAPQAEVSGVVVGSALASAGAASGWFGHNGWLVVAPSALLVLFSILRLQEHGVLRRSRAKSFGLVVGSILFTLALLVIIGELALAQTLSGAACVQDLVNTPGIRGSLPNNVNSVQSSFSPFPLGRLCSWSGTAGRLEVAPQVHSAIESIGTYASGIVGALLVAFSVLIPRKDRRELAVGADA